MHDVELLVLSPRNLRWLCAAWPRFRLRNRPDAATPLDSAEGEEGEHPSAATRRRSWLGEDRQYLDGHFHSTVHARKQGGIQCKVPVLRA